MNENQKMIPPRLCPLVKSLAAFKEVKAIMLFGSRTYGDANPRSDVDLAISAPNISLRHWLNLKMLAENAPTLLSITLVKLEDSPSELRERVLKEGVVLYEQQEKGRG